MPAENYLEIGNRLRHRKFVLRVSLVIFLVRMVLPSEIEMSINFASRELSASPNVSHKRVFTLICWQPGSANTGLFAAFSDF